MKNIPEWIPKDYHVGKNLITTNDILNNRECVRLGSNNRNAQWLKLLSEGKILIAPEMENLLKEIKESDLYHTAWNYHDLNDEQKQVEQSALYLAQAILEWMRENYKQ